jgi:hypothetical protein
MEGLGKTTRNLSGYRISPNTQQEDCPLECDARQCRGTGASNNIIMTLKSVDALYCAREHWLLKWGRNTERQSLGPLRRFGKETSAKIRALASLCVPVRPSVCPHVTTREPLNGFSWNLVFRSWTSSGSIWSVTRYIYTVYESRDSAVDIETDYGLDDKGVGVRVPVEARIFTSCRPDRLWGPPRLLANGNRGLLPRA